MLKPHIRKPLAQGAHGEDLAEGFPQERTRQHQAALVHRYVGFPLKIKQVSGWIFIRTQVAVTKC
jgi:hypothetical protein